MNIQSLTKPQLTGLLRAAKAARERDWLMILVAYLHALRAGEVTTFQPSAVQDGYLTIAREKGSFKTVQPLLTNTDPLLDERDALIELALNSPFDQPVFKVSTVHFWRLMQRYGEAAGLPKHLRHPHVLKHSICSHLIPVIGIEMVREWAGHKNISSTGFYLRRSAEEVASAVNSALCV